jgi:hypothetical protein
MSESTYKLKIPEPVSPDPASKPEPVPGYRLDRDAPPVKQRNA